MRSVLILTVGAALALVPTALHAGEVRVDFGFGLTFEAADGFFAVANAEELVAAVAASMDALRVGAFFDARTRIAGPAWIGSTVGLWAFAASPGGGPVVPLIDLVSRGFGRLKFGPVVIQAHLGYNLALAPAAVPALAHKVDAGGRLGIGVFYVEVARLVWVGGGGTTRLGAGLSFRG